MAGSESGHCDLVRVCSLVCGDWLDSDKATGAAAVDKFHPSIDFGEERVIAAPADIQARLQAGSPLTHDN